jgi:hypothetical protein
VAEPVEWHNPLPGGSSHPLDFLVMKMICFSCVLFMNELMLVAMTDDVWGDVLISLML